MKLVRAKQKMAIKARRLFAIGKETVINTASKKDISANQKRALTQAIGRGIAIITVASAVILARLFS